MGLEIITNFDNSKTFFIYIMNILTNLTPIIYHNAEKHHPKLILILVLLSTKLLIIGLLIQEISHHVVLKHNVELLCK